MEAASQLTGWPVPQESAAVVMHAGLAVALFIYFIHDWASIVSSFVSILVFRKRPMTLDERMLFFLLLSTIPHAAASIYLAPQIDTWTSSNLSMVLQFGIGTLLLWFTERMNRRRKSLFDLNTMESLAMGIGQALAALPGVGRATGGLAALQARNFNREAAVKYLLIATLPILIFQILRIAPGASESGGVIDSLGWLNATTVFFVSLGSGLFSVNFFVRFFQRNGIGGVVAYRTAVLILIPALLWWIAQA